MNALPLWRRLVAGIAGLAGAFALFSMLTGREKSIALIPAVFLLVAAITVHVPRLGAQLLARGAWWSNFALGFFISFVGNHQEAAATCGMTTCFGLALLFVGQKGLNEAGERTGFAPSGFRTTFMLLMMLVLADAQTLGLFAFVFSREHESQPYMWIPTAGALGLIVAFVGLYRLSLWGVVASLLTSAVVAVGFLAALGAKEELTLFVALFCGLQILVAAPMLICILARKTLPKAPPVVGIWFSRVAIVGMWMYSAYRATV